MLSEYVEACSAAGRRSRYVVIGLMLASVLAFSAGWNSHQTGWRNSRSRAAAVSARIAKYHEDHKADSLLPPLDSLRMVHAAIEDSLSGESYVKASNALVSSYVRTYNELLKVSLSDSSVIRQSLIYLLGLPDRLMSAEQLQARSNAIENERVSSLMGTQVPVLGIAFDINDLSVFSGLAFALLLVWLLLSVMREYENLRIFERYLSGPVSRHEGYQLLLMYQVMTAPRAIGLTQNAVPYFLRRYLPTLLDLIPFLVMANLWWYDYTSRSLAFQVNPDATIVSLWVAGGLLALVAVITVCCLIVNLCIDHVWDRIHRVVSQPHDPEEVDEG